MTTRTAPATLYRPATDLARQALKGLERIFSYTWLAIPLRLAVATVF